MERREECGRVYGPFVGRALKYDGTVRQRHFAGTLSKEVNPVNGSDPNMERNSQEYEAEGLFLNSD